MRKIHFKEFSNCSCTLYIDKSIRKDFKITYFNNVGNIAQTQFLSVVPLRFLDRISSKRVKSFSSPAGTDAELC